jgi:hypothetical protein
MIPSNSGLYNWAAVVNHMVCLGRTVVVLLRSLCCADGVTKAGAAMLQLSLQDAARMRHP